MNVNNTNAIEGHNELKLNVDEQHNDITHLKQQRDVDDDDDDDDDEVQEITVLQPHEKSQWV